MTTDIKKQARELWDELVDEVEEATGQHKSTTDRVFDRANKAVDDGFKQARELVDSVVTGSDKHDAHKMLRGLKNEVKDGINEAKDYFKPDDHDDSDNNSGFLKTMGELWNDFCDLFH